MNNISTMSPTRNAKLWDALPLALQATLHEPSTVLDQGTMICLKKVNLEDRTCSPLGQPVCHANGIDTIAYYCTRYHPKHGPTFMVAELR